MDLKEMALRMYPYWLLGAGVITCTVLAGLKDVVRIEKIAVLKWIKFLFALCIIRVFLFTLFHNFSYLHDAAKNISVIPVPLTLTVFWEDACHSLPLFLLKRVIGNNKWLKPFYYLLLGMVMLEFGLGHAYQGLFAMIALSLYIPYSISYGEKYGFGTVMVCHTLFDLTTILSMKFLLGT